MSEENIYETVEKTLERMFEVEEIIDSDKLVDKQNGNREYISISFKPKGDDISQMILKRNLKQEIKKDIGEDYDIKCGTQGQPPYSVSVYL